MLPKTSISGFRVFSALNIFVIVRFKQTAYTRSIEKIILLKEIRNSKAASIIRYMIINKFLMIGPGTSKKALAVYTGMPVMNILNKYANSTRGTGFIFALLPMISNIAYHGIKKPMAMEAAN